MTIGKKECIEKIKIYCEENNISDVTQYSFLGGLLGIIIVLESIKSHINYDEIYEASIKNIKKI